MRQQNYFHLCLAKFLDTLAKPFFMNDSKELGYNIL